MSERSFGETLKRVSGGDLLTADESAEAFGTIMCGQVSDTRMAAFLTALAMRRPAVEEIVGAVRAMRSAMTTIHAPPNTIDVCGTGGDGLGTLNVSTATAFVVAGCGVPVAKHGNRNMSSRTGTADVLERLGIAIDLEPDQAEECLAQTGFCFLFAPAFHSAMKHVAPVRRELGFRTIFNLIGPLSNPAAVRRQLIGVFSKEWIEPLAAVLRALGTEAAWIVHSDDGMDEISIAAPTQIAALEGGRIERRQIAPEDVGVARSQLASISGGDAEQNADAIRRLLSGTVSPFRDIVILNATAALVVAGAARDLQAGAALATQSIDDGMARDVLVRAAAFSSRAKQ